MDQTSVGDLTQGLPLPLSRCGLLVLPVVAPLTLFSGLGPACFQGQGTSTQLFAAFTFWMIPFDRAILVCKESEREQISPSCPHEGEKATPRDAHDIEHAPGGIREFGSLPTPQTTEFLPMGLGWA